MLDHATLLQALPACIDSVEFPELGNKISGKVRDCYVVGDKRVLIASDRLSAFDKVLTTIPFKGQILNGMASYWFQRTAHIVPNHLITEPHPNVFVGLELIILPIEVVVRGYIAGSAARDYEAGRDVSGVGLPKGMKKFQALDKPLITPSTKAEAGQHDEPISEGEILERGIVKAMLWQEVREKALELFAFGTAEAAKRDLILVDTKYEFGLRQLPNGKQELTLADEVHTPDSSRYWVRSTYQSRFDNGEAPDNFDKEFVRSWLISKGYMGDGTPPEFPNEFRVDIAKKYIRAFEMITGRSFEGRSKPIDVEAILASLM